MDHQEIQTLISLYSYLLHAREWSGLPAIFTQDARWEIEGTTFVLDGPELHVGLRGLVEPSRLLLQILSPAIIEIEGDAATARTSAHEILENANDGVSLDIYGLYFDAFRKEEGVWKFASRRFRQLKMTVTPLEPAAA